jgi:hypothetical protein
MYVHWEGSFDWPSAMELGCCNTAAHFEHKQMVDKGSYTEF